MKSLNNPSNSNQGGQHISVTPDDLTFAQCECGSTTFQEGYRIGKLSRLHPKNPSGEVQSVHVPVNVCLECGAEIQQQEIGE